jgi:hypothetical protein
VDGPVSECPSHPNSILWEAKIDTIGANARGSGQIAGVRGALYRSLV